MLTRLSEPLQGDSVPFTLGSTAGMVSTVKGYNYILAAQTPAEWAQLQRVYELTATYDEAFFADHFLLVVDLLLPTTNSKLTVEGLTLSGGVLQVNGTEWVPSHDSDSMAPAQAVLEVPRAAAANASSVVLYLKREIVQV